ncbi:hypothetical protein D3C79_771760 [compost metagenome]
MQVCRGEYPAAQWSRGIATTQRVAQPTIAKAHWRAHSPLWRRHAKQRCRALPWFASANGQGMAKLLSRSYTLAKHLLLRLIEVPP